MTRALHGQRLASTGRFVLTVQDQRFSALRGDEPADAVPEATVRTVQNLVFDNQPLNDAVRLGDAHVDGNTAVVTRLLATFEDHRTRYVLEGSVPHHSPASIEPQPEQVNEVETILPVSAVRPVGDR